MTEPPETAEQQAPPTVPAQPAEPEPSAVRPTASTGAGGAAAAPPHAEPLLPAQQSEPSRQREPAEPAEVEPAEVEPGPAEGGAAAPAGLLSAATAELDLKPALEAVLMVVDEPATEDHLAKVLDRPRRAVGKALRELSDDYTREGRGFDLRLVAGGWRFYTRPAFAPAVEKFVLDGQQARLTQAALETLAVVAYRQPVSRSRVSAVRGVNCDGVMRTLLQRGLVEEGGTEPETGAILYRTTNYFLERMGLRSLDELPELAPFLPEADAVEAESQEGLPSFDPDAPDETPSGSMTTSITET